MEKNDLELIPEEVRNDNTVTMYTRIAQSNLILFRFVRDPQTKEWIKFPQSKIDELNKDRQLIKPLETRDERLARLEKARLRREAKKQAEQDFEDELEDDDFDNEAEIARAQELLSLLRAQEEVELDYEED